MTEYIQTPIYEISSPKMWSTMIYKSLDKAMLKARTIVEEYDGEDEYPITINYFPNGRIAKGFNEDTQSIEESPETPSELPYEERIMSSEEEVVAFREYLSKFPFMTPELREKLDNAFEFFGLNTPYTIISSALNDIDGMRGQALEEESNP